MENLRCNCGAVMYVDRKLGIIVCLNCDKDEYEEFKRKNPYCKEW